MLEDICDVKHPGKTFHWCYCCNPWSLKVFLKYCLFLTMSCKSKIFINQHIHPLKDNFKEPHNQTYINTAFQTIASPQAICCYVDASPGACNIYEAIFL